MGDSCRLSFGDDPELYDRVRPSYPASMPRSTPAVARSPSGHTTELLLAAPTIERRDVSSLVMIAQDCATLGGSLEHAPEMGVDVAYSKGAEFGVLESEWGPSGPEGLSDAASLCRGPFGAVAHKATAGNRGCTGDGVSSVPCPSAGWSSRPGLLACVHTEVTTNCVAILDQTLHAFVYRRGRVVFDFLE